MFRVFGDPVLPASSHKTLLDAPCILPPAGGISGGREGRIDTNTWRKVIVRTLRAGDFLTTARVISDLAKGSLCFGRYVAIGT